jgi:hypothetical protein
MEEERSVCSVQGLGWVSACWLRSSVVQWGGLAGVQKTARIGAVTGSYWGIEPAQFVVLGASYKYPSQLVF